MSMPLLAAMAFVVIYGISYYQASRNAALADRIEVTAFPAVRLSHELETLTLRIRHILQNSIVLQDADMILEADELTLEVEALIVSMKTLLPIHTALIDEIDEAFSGYSTLARSLTMQLIVHELNEEMYPKVEEMNRRYGRLNNLLLESAVRLEASMDQAFEDARRSRTKSQIHMRFAIILCISLMLIITFGLIGAVVRPLRRITDVTESIARGKLDAVLDYRSRDELGRLADSFRSMQSSLIADIQRREQAETALRDSEGRYRGIFEHATTGIVRTTPQGQVVAANRALIKMMGYDTEAQARAEITNIGEQVYRYPSDRDRVMRILSERGELTDEFCFRRRDNTEFYVQASLWAERSVTGQVTAIEGVVTDITARKDAEGALKRALTDIARSNAELEKSNEALHHTNLELRAAQARLIQSEKMASMGRFVAGIAHEFNNPISAVQSSSMNVRTCVERLDNEIKGLPATMQTERIQELMSLLSRSERVIFEGSFRVAGIVSKMKNFIRLDESDKQFADIHDMMEETLSVFYHERKSGIQIVKDFGHIPSLLCYPAKLNQMFLQLLSNANHAITDAGTITIQTRSDREFATISFLDTGIGIPENMQQRIFEPGFTTWGVGVGVGLGLTIAYQIAQEHGGDVQLESKLGEGTRVMIRLPLKPA